MGDLPPRGAAAEWSLVGTDRHMARLGRQTSRRRADGGAHQRRPGIELADLGRVFDGRDSGLIHWEVSVAPLRDGRILAVAWVHDPRTMEDHQNAFALSEDDGATWSAPRSTGLHGQTCKVLQLPDGRLLSVYRRLDQSGLWANLATLGPADEWTNVEDQAIWQGVGPRQSERATPPIRSRHCASAIPRPCCCLTATCSWRSGASRTARA